MLPTNKEPTQEELVKLFHLGFVQLKSINKFKHVSSWMFFRLRSGFVFDFSASNLNYPNFEDDRELKGWIMFTLHEE
jgi:hypothetical protein